MPPHGQMRWVIYAATQPVAVGAGDEVVVTVAGNFAGDRGGSEHGGSLSLVRSGVSDESAARCPLWLSARERSREPEPRQYAGLEPGHAADPAAGKGEH